MTVVSDGSVGDEIDMTIAKSEAITHRFPYQVKTEYATRSMTEWLLSTTTTLDYSPTTPIARALAISTRFTRYTFDPLPTTGAGSWGNNYAN